MSLHPRIVEVVAELEAAQQEVHDTLAALPADVLDKRPADGSWTITEIVEHLVKVEVGAGRVVGSMLKQLEGTVDTETDPVGPTMARFQVHLPRTKLEAPEVVQPSGLSLAESLAALDASRARLIASLKAGSGRALHTTQFPHPFLGPLNGYQWALLAAQHQRRHLVQIANVATAVA